MTAIPMSNISSNASWRQLLASEIESRDNDEYALSSLIAEIKESQLKAQELLSHCDKNKDIFGVQVIHLSMR